MSKNKIAKAEDTYLSDENGIPIMDHVKEPSSFNHNLITNSLYDHKLSTLGFFC